MKTVMMIFSALIILLAFWIYSHAGIFDKKTMNDLGPALFPRMVAMGLIGLSLLQLFVCYRDTKSTYRVSEVFDKRVLFPLIGMGLAVFYVAGLMVVGYLIATTLFVAAMLWFLQMRKPLNVTVIAIATSGIIYWLFEKILIVPLPRGKFF